MDNYVNPKLYGVDYTVIDKEIEKSVNQIGASMQSIAEQRRLAYEKLKSDYSQYNDLTYLDRAKGLDEASNRAIMDSVNVNIAEFSNLSEYDKAQNINYVKEAKAANAAIEKMIALKNSNATINKTAKNGKYYEFLNDLSNFQNIEVKPREGAIGYRIVHNRTDENGEVVGQEEYDMSEIMSMSSMFYDVTEVIDGIDDGLDDLVTASQKGKDAAKMNGKSYTVENLRGAAQSFVSQMTAEEKRDYFAEKVNPFQDFSPSVKLDENGNEVRKLTQKEIASIRERNTKILEDYVANNVFSRLQESPEPQVKTSERKASDPTPSDIQNVSNFTRDFYKTYAKGDVSFIRKYLTPAGMEAKIDGATKELVITQSKSERGYTTEEVEVDGESARGEKQTKKGQEKEVFRIPLDGDIRDVADEFYLTVAENSPIRYLKFIYNEGIKPTDDEIQDILNRYEYKNQWSGKKIDPLNQIPTPFGGTQYENLPKELEGGAVVKTASGTFRPKI